MAPRFISVLSIMERGDTERNPAFWARLNQLNVAMLVIETAFSNREKELAKISLHLSPVVLAQELDCIAKDQNYPIYIPIPNRRRPT